MSNLTPYAPTVPSGPTSTRFSKEALAGLSIPELQRKKDALEAEIRALGGILRSVCFTRCQSHLPLPCTNE